MFDFQVWDVLSNDDVIAIASAAHSEEAAAKSVVAATIAACKHRFPNLKRDDCTVICLFLDKMSAYDKIWQSSAYLMWIVSSLAHYRLYRPLVTWV